MAPRTIQADPQLLSSAEAEARQRGEDATAAMLARARHMLRGMMRGSSVFIVSSQKHAFVYHAHQIADQYMRGVAR